MWLMLNQCDATTICFLHCGHVSQGLSLELVWYHVLLPCCISSFLCSLDSFSSFYCTFKNFRGLHGSAGKGVSSWLRRSTAFRDCNQRWELRKYKHFFIVLSFSCICTLLEHFFFWLLTNFLLFHPTIDHKYLNVPLFFYFNFFIIVVELFAVVQFNKKNDQQRTLESKTQVAPGATVYVVLHFMSSSCSLWRQKCF